MVRSAADATRFTATGPYASSKPAPRSSSIDVSRPGQSGETAAEKIARLREAARLEKIGRESKFDRIVGAGRIWADRLHRVTALALIAFTGVAGFYTIASATDMIMYNRKKKREYYAQQKRLKEEAVQTARLAAAEGTASAEQMTLLAEAKAGEEAESRKDTRGIFTKTKDFLYGGLSKEEKGLALLNRPSEALLKEAEPESSLGGITQGAGEGMGIVKAVEEAQKQHSVRGGLLDQLGEEAARAASDTRRSWGSWANSR